MLFYKSKGVFDSPSNMMPSYCEEILSAHIIFIILLSGGCAQTLWEQFCMYK